MKQIYYFFLAAMLLLISGSARATTHVITAVFDQNIGSYVYSPSQPFAVNVGDTIDWQMPFSSHTLGVTLNGVMVVDDGASNNTPPGGNDEKYVVPSVGTYTFLCTLHSTMHSSFTASAAGVEIPQETKMVMDPIYPNPAMDEAMVHFTLDNPAHVTLRIYNSTGTLVQTPTNEEMGAGFHMLMIDTKQLASGSYQYVLQAGDAVLRRAMMVVK